MRRYRKGAGTTAGTVIIIMIFLMFFGVYIYMANNQIQSTIQLNLESIQLLKLKSTFYLFERSINVTWFVSTVQAVFAAGDESIGCGYDGSRMSEGYWYQRDPRDGYSALREIKTMDGKYNRLGANPRMCLPQDPDIADYIKKKLAEGGYLNLRMLRPEEAGGVSIEIPRKDDSVDAMIDVRLDSTKVTSVFTHRITASYASGVITKTDGYENIVNTNLSQMAAAGRNVVEGLLELGNSALPASLTYQGTSTSDSYKNVVKLFLENYIRTASARLPPDLVFVIVDVETTLTASDDSTKGVLPASRGLVVLYSATVRYIENSQLPAGAASYPWPTDSRRLTSCYGYRRDPAKLDQGEFHQGIDMVPMDDNEKEIKAVDSGVVADVYGQCPVGSLRSECGKPGNSRYGNFVLIRHDGFYSFYAHLAHDIRVSPGQPVSAGDAIGTMGSSGRSSGAHLHFEIRKDGSAGSQENPCLYINCAESAGKKCITTVISPTATEVYYYHDEDTNTFARRPIELEFRAEDYLQALDCTGINVQQPSLFSWASPRDMACCVGRLYSCNADIPGLPKSQKLATGQACREFGIRLDCTPAGFEEVA